jgi:hypothetical protein
MRALGSIDPRTTLRPEHTCIDASAGIDASIPALRSTPCACPSIQVHTSMDRSQLVPRWKCACPSIQDRTSMSATQGSMDRSPLVPRWRCAHRIAPCACPRIQVRLSLDRSLHVALRSWSLRTLSYLSFARPASSTAFHSETSTRGMVPRGGGSSRPRKTQRRGTSWETHRRTTASSRRPPISI